MSTAVRSLRPDSPSSNEFDNQTLPEETIEQADRSTDEVRTDRSTDEVRTDSSTTAPLLVSVDEAARLLSISTRTVYRLIEDASLPFIKLGRRTLVSVASLENWIADQEVAVPPAVDDRTAGSFDDDAEVVDNHLEAWDETEACALRVINKVEVFTDEVNTLAKERPAPVPLSPKGNAPEALSETDTDGAQEDDRTFDDRSFDEVQTPPSYEASRSGGYI